jgi:hypothetical protein
VIAGNFNMLFTMHCYRYRQEDRAACFYERVSHMDVSGVTEDGSRISDNRLRKARINALRRPPTTHL